MSDQDKTVKTPNRRQVIGTMGLLGAGVVLGACTPAMSQTGTTKPNIDGDVLTFALNLEYLEAAFYLAAVGRLGELPGSGPAPILPSGFDGTVGIQFSDPAVKAYAQEIAQDELNHVNFLLSALTAAGVPASQLARPALDIGPAFAAAGNAASKGAITTFNPYANDLFFLHGAFIFEDVGVTAYKGAAALITNPDYLTAAAGILAVEAYHAGEIRTLLYAQKDTVAAAGLKVSDIVQAISDLRDSVDGSTDDDQGIVAGTGNPSFVTGANIVLADENSIAYSRTTDQVLAIVYLGDKTKPGGFFPNGLNGKFR